ncbi:MAG: nitroimidazol reductase NimA-like FMN-containing flavoprotein [Natronomonas sp.]|jgi:nitroimidazol reductase NimA-like FMN-containing flavoprotein (pyridoxamine 5'-phosphate oxidase superfamily)
MDDDSRFQGEPIADSTMETLLREQGFGVLSLAREGMAYGIPISAGYDDGRLYFVFFGFGAASSRKLEMVQHTETGSFLVHEITSPDDWWSVIAQGAIRLVDSRKEWERLEAAMRDNAWRPNILDDAAKSNGVEGYVLEVADVRGWRGPDAEFEALDEA